MAQAELEIQSPERDTNPLTEQAIEQSKQDWNKFLKVLQQPGNEEFLRSPAVAIGVAQEVLSDQRASVLQRGAGGLEEVRKALDKTALPEESKKAIISYITRPAGPEVVRILELAPRPLPAGYEAAKGMAFRKLSIEQQERLNSSPLNELSDKEIKLQANRTRLFSFGQGKRISQARAIVNDDVMASLDMKELKALAAGKKFPETVRSLPWFQKAFGREQTDFDQLPNQQFVKGAARELATRTARAESMAAEAAKVAHVEVFPIRVLPPIKADPLQGLANLNTPGRDNGSKWEWRQNANQSPEKLLEKGQILALGYQGEDVKVLAQFLKDTWAIEPGHAALSHGKFDKTMDKAVKELQMKFTTELGEPDGKFGYNTARESGFADYILARSQDQELQKAILSKSRTLRMERSGEQYREAHKALAGMLSEAGFQPDADAMQGNFNESMKEQVLAFQKMVKETNENFDVDGIVGKKTKSELISHVEKLELQRKKEEQQQKAENTGEVLQAKPAKAEHLAVDNKITADNSARQAEPTKVLSPAAVDKKMTADNNAKQLEPKKAVKTPAAVDNKMTADNNAKQSEPAKIVSSAAVDKKMTADNNARQAEPVKVVGTSAAADKKMSTDVAATQDSLSAELSSSLQDMVTDALIEGDLSKYGNHVENGLTIDQYLDRVFELKGATARFFGNTNELGLNRALAGLNAEQMETMKKVFVWVGGKSDIETVLKWELSGNDLQEAMLRLQDKETEADALGLATRLDSSLLRGSVVAMLEEMSTERIKNAVEHFNNSRKGSFLNKAKKDLNVVDFSIAERLAMGRTVEHDLIKLTASVRPLKMRGPAEKAGTRAENYLNKVIGHRTSAELTELVKSFNSADPAPEMPLEDYINRHFKEPKKMLAALGIENKKTGPS